MSLFLSVVEFFGVGGGKKQVIVAKHELALIKEWC